MTLYFHIRLKDNNGGLWAKGGFTFAAQPFDAHLVWGVAKCHESDNYNKKIGRAIAEGRASTADRCFKTVVMDEKSAAVFAETLAGIMFNNEASQPTEEMIKLALLPRETA